MALKPTRNKNNATSYLYNTLEFTEHFYTDIPLNPQAL